MSICHGTCPAAFDRLMADPVRSGRKQVNH